MPGCGIAKWAASSTPHNQGRYKLLLASPWWEAANFISEIRWGDFLDETRKRDFVPVQFELALPIQLRIMPENAIFIERQPPVGGQIICNPRPQRDALA